MGWTRRAFVAGGAAGAALGAWGLRAVGREDPAAGLLRPAGGEGVLNDASLLSETPIARRAALDAPPGEPLLADLRALLREAAAEGRPVAAGAARHSMGGHAIPRDGVALSLASPAVSLDPEAGTFRAAAGARWRDVIAALDPLGWSPKVMQSNNDFGIGATFAVNAHGWPCAHPPMGGTVRRARLLLADGTDLWTSREEEPALFAAAMGGYGLTGLLTGLEVEAVPNALLAPSFRVMPAEEFGPAFARAARESPMAYGRMAVDRAGFFREALLVAYAPVEGEPPPAEGSGWVSRASRPIFRAQVGSDWMKRRRWWMETALGPRLAGPASRNGLLNEPVATLDDRDPARTDILHEYFVPPAAWDGFLEAARAIVPASFQDLLNVTLRWVERDDLSLLSYAPDGPRLCAVLLFSQEMSARAEADMARMTRDLIDAVLGLGGSYYLPYRPHATVAQFRRAYPRWEELAALKRALDPGLLFRNGFWDSYLAEG